MVCQNGIDIRSHLIQGKGGGENTLFAFLPNSGKGQFLRLHFSLPISFLQYRIFLTMIFRGKM